MGPTSGVLGEHLRPTKHPLQIYQSQGERRARGSRKGPVWAGLKVMVSSFALPEFFRDLREEKTDSAVCSQNKQSTLPHHKTSPAAARRRVGPSKCDQGRVPGLPLSAQMVPPKTWCPWAREGPIITNEAGVTAWSGASSVWALDGIMSINVPTAGIFTAITGQPDSHGPACTWLPMSQT